MAADWTAIENALQAWVKTAVGFDNAHTYWLDSNAGRPTSGSFATLEITERVPLGATPQRVHTEHPDNPQGEEIEVAAEQVLDCGFRVQIYAPPIRGTKPGTPRGATNAAALAERVRLAGGLPSVMDALETAGLSVYDMGQVRYVPALIGTDFEGRAILDCRFYAADSVSEFTGYIDTVEVTDEETETLQTITIPDDL